MNANNPIISVILPCYNAEKFLPLAVDSILNQTYKNFELIIIDDGSTDNSNSFLHKIQDPRVRVLLNDKNQGLIFTLNRGISEARAEFISRMDADDIATPNRLRIQLDYLQKNALDLVGCNAKIFGVETRRILTYPQHEDAIRLMALFASPFAHPTVLGRRKVFELLYSQEYPHAEDYELWTRVLAAGFRCGNVPQVLLNYREHANQISKTKAEQQQASFRKALKKYAENTLDKEGFECFERLNFARSTQYSTSEIMELLRFITDLAQKWRVSDAVAAEFMLFIMRRAERSDFKRIFHFHNACRQAGIKLNAAQLAQAMYLSFSTLNHSSMVYRVARKLLR